MAIATASIQAPPAPMRRNEPWRMGVAGGAPDSFYLRARFLDTGLSRFVSRDPAGFQGGGHLYNYAGNAPTMGIDPTGKMFMGVPSAFDAAALASPVVGRCSELQVRPKR